MLEGGGLGPGLGYFRLGRARAPAGYSPSSALCVTLLKPSFISLPLPPPCILPCLSPPSLPLPPSPQEISKSNVVDDMVSSNSLLYKPGEHPDHVVVIK